MESGSFLSTITEDSPAHRVVDNRGDFTCLRIWSLALNCGWSLSLSLCPPETCRTRNPEIRCTCNCVRANSKRINRWTSFQVILSRSLLCSHGFASASYQNGRISPCTRSFCLARARPLPRRISFRFIGRSDSRPIISFAGVSLSCCVYVSHNQFLCLSVVHTCLVQHRVLEKPVSSSPFSPGN